MSVFEERLNEIEAEISRYSCDPLRGVLLVDGQEIRGHNHGHEGHVYRAHFVCGVIIVEHRLIWRLCHGSWPRHEIDHINGCCEDNRIENLRDVTHGINMRNKRRYKRQRSLPPGIYSNLCHGSRVERYRAQVGIGGGRPSWKSKFVDTIEEAVAIRQAMLERHGYSERHCVEV